MSSQPTEIVVGQRDRWYKNVLHVEYDGDYNNPRFKHITTTDDSLIGKTFKLGPERIVSVTYPSRVFVVVRDVLHRNGSVLKYKKNDKWIPTHITIAVQDSEEMCLAFIKH